MTVKEDVVERDLVSVKGDLDRACLERRWTDGAPVVAPTVERVDEMLAANDLDGREVVVTLPPISFPVTADMLAANAVMAGCRPEDLPYVLAGLHAVADPDFNLPILVTTGGGSVTLVVSGPEEELATRGFNWGSVALGPGSRANLAVSRGLNLVVRNALQLERRIRSTVGHPGQLAFCVVEAPVEGWTSLNTMRSLPEDRPSVTAFFSESPHQVSHHYSRDPEAILAAVADVMASTTLMTGAYVVVLGRDHVGALVDAGWDHARVRAHLAQRARRSVRHLKEWGRVPGRVYPEDEEITKPAVVAEADVLVVPSGGPGGFSAVLPPNGIDNLVAFHQLDPEVGEPDDDVARRSSLPVSRTVRPVAEAVRDREEVS